MSSLLDLLKLIIPFILELIQLLKGQPKQVVQETISKASTAANEHMATVGVAPSLKV